MKSFKPDRLKRVGFISKLIGYKGEVVLVVEQGTLTELKKSDFFFFYMEGLPVPFQVIKIYEKGIDLVVHFEGINDEASAKKIVQKDVFSERLRIRKQTQLTWDDLIGFTAIDALFGSLGPIEGVDELPMQVIARCTVNEKEVLFPLNEDVIEEIDESKKEVRLRLPDGLIDVYLSDPGDEEPE